MHPGTHKYLKEVVYPFLIVVTIGSAILIGVGILALKLGG